MTREDLERHRARYHNKKEK